jgi:hypothetical protein
MESCWLSKELVHSYHSALKVNPIARRRDDAVVSAPSRPSASCLPHHVAISCGVETRLSAGCNEVIPTVCRHVRVRVGSSPGEVARWVQVGTRSQWWRAGSSWQRMASGSHFAELREGARSRVHRSAVFLVTVCSDRRTVCRLASYCLFHLTAPS